jgi:hypothetical protein
VSGDRFTDIREELTGRARVHLYVFVEVESAVMRVYAVVVVVGVTAFGGGVLPAKRRCLAADEALRLPKDIDPQCWIESRIVNVTDQCGEPLCLIHSGFLLDHSRLHPLADVAARFPSAETNSRLPIMTTIGLFSRVVLIGAVRGII